MLQRDMALAGILTAFGLAGAAGLNAYIPLLLVAILGRTGVLQLAAPFDALTSLPVIGLLVVLLMVEIVVDKIPGADHVNDIIQTFVRPAAGAVLFAANAGVVTDAHPALLVACGLIPALGVHATKAAARPVVNVATVGLGAPAVSVAEDTVSLSTSLVAVFLPLLVAAIFVVFCAAAFWVWSRRARKKRAQSRPAPS